MNCFLLIVILDVLYALSRSCIKCDNYLYVVVQHFYIEIPGPDEMGFSAKCVDLHKLISRPYEQ